MRWISRAALSLVLGLALWGCGSKPPPPAVVQLTAKAGPSVNPDASDRASPVIVRILSPAPNSVVSIEFKPTAKFIGVVAAFRSIDRATWRADAPVPANKTTKLAVTVDGLVVKLGPGS